MPPAGARLITYGRNGKQAVQPEQVLVAYASSKFWRGYYLVVLVEQRTGVPLVWTLRDAAEDEARAIVELVTVLRSFWPDCPLEVIVGDSAWDEKWACRYCVNEKIHPVFRRHPSLRNIDYSLSFFESESVARFTGEGRAYCRLHQLEMRYSTAEYGKQRLRFVCPEGCGKVSLPMRHNYAALTYFPHHSFGRPELHAMRIALLARRNACEALFSSLKVSNKLGLRGADRTRLTRYESVLGLVSLAFTFKSAFLLADLRLRNKDMPFAPPPPLDHWLI